MSSSAYTAWPDTQAVCVEDLIQAGNQAFSPTPLASERLKGIPVYHAPLLYNALVSPDSRQALQSEWVEVLTNGAGVLALQNPWQDTNVVDDASHVFQTLIDKERNQHKGDHFAQTGCNDRVWNALEKMALQAPKVFVSYYANPWIAALSQAWLGPAWQITSQINVVHPGGKAQQPHCDYHLGFQTNAQAQSYPLHVHRISPFLTLQAAVAHVDMPLASGPTRFLPGSQRYPLGYLAWRSPDVIAHFQDKHVQLPLNKGDMLFFNPALLHAAGDNHTADVARMANLLQVSSAMGRAMESVDRQRISTVIYPALQAWYKKSKDATALEAVIGTSAEGYSFPTNLDRNPPLQGLAPASMQDLLRQAVYENWSEARWADTLQAYAWRRRSHD